MERMLLQYFEPSAQAILTVLLKSRNALRESLDGVVCVEASKELR